MTITKEQAKENVKNYYETQKADKIRKAQEYCDTTVEPTIIAKSNEGENQTTFYGVDLDILPDACNIIRSKGFWASIQGTTLFVKWYD